MSLIDQLVKVYLTQESWHKEKLAEEDARLYFRELLRQGNIITVQFGNNLLGYVEFWRINYEQFGRIVCGEGFSAIQEDVVHGYIAYVANTFIQPESRRGEVYKVLRDRFIEANMYCTHFVGEARRKSCAPLKVFKRSQILARI